jgi:hypothetical protein
MAQVASTCTRRWRAGADDVEDGEVEHRPAADHGEELSGLRRAVAREQVRHLRTLSDVVPPLLPRDPVSEPVADRRDIAAAERRVDVGDDKRWGCCCSY